MNRSRLWTVAATVLSIGLLVGTWFIGVAPQLSEAHQADQAREQAIALNNAHRNALLELQAQHERIDEILAELDEVHRVIPELPEKAEFLAQVASMARAAGVETHVVTFSEPTAYVTPGGAPEEYTSAANRFAAGGLYSVAVALSVQGTEAATLRFLDSLQQGDRLVMIHTAQIAEGEGEGEASLNLSGYIFGMSASTVASTEGSASP